MVSKRKRSSKGGADEGGVEGKSDVDIADTSMSSMGMASEPIAGDTLSREERRKLKKQRKKAAKQAAMEANGGGGGKEGSEKKRQKKEAMAAHESKLDKLILAEQADAEERASAKGTCSLQWTLPEPRPPIFASHARELLLTLAGGPNPTWISVKGPRPARAAVMLVEGLGKASMLEHRAEMPFLSSLAAHMVVLRFGALAWRLTHRAACRAARWELQLALRRPRPRPAALGPSQETRPRRTPGTKIEVFQVAPALLTCPPPGKRNDQVGPRPLPAPARRVPTPRA